MTYDQKKRLLRCAAGTALFGAACAALLFAFSKTGVFWRCPFHLLTSLNCPGCGCTRAAAALLHLRFAESLSYNYAYPLEFLYLLYVLFGAAKRYVMKGRFSFYPKYPILDYIVLGLLLIWWVVRNILKI